MNCSLCNMRSSTQYNRLCEKHYVKFLNKINNDLKYNETNQSGGNLLSSISKIGKLYSKHSDSISKNIDKVSKLTESINTASNNLYDVRRSINSNSDSLNVNYNSSQLINSNPLGSTSSSFQRFGDYICVKQSLINDLRNIISELLINKNQI